MSQLTLDLLPDASTALNPPSARRSLAVPIAHSAPRNWIAVASAEHARRGAAGADVGFMQVCHGKRGPLQRVRPGDRVAYYAPGITMGGRERWQKFVTIGVVQGGDPYAFDMGGGFVPFRRDVRYVPAHEADIHPLLDTLEFVEDRKHWGAKFRFGLFAVSDHDMRCIADAMGAAWGQL